MTDSETVETPAWVKDAVFYQIFPDRFALSPSISKPSNLEAWDSPPTVYGYKGGDLVGIAEHLDYLVDLGVTAIYLNPIFESGANHRYHTNDYFHVDPILGGDDALRILLERAHERDVKVILDGVFNHCGRGLYQFNHLLENRQQSPYLDWFRVTSWPLHPYVPPDEPPGYECWWGNRELPKLITDTPAVRHFIFEVAEYWLHQGIDGWRLDVPAEIDDDDFWREFRRRVKAINPEAYIVGELWEDSRRWLQGDQFDGVQNYLFTKAVIGFLVAGTGTFDRGTLPDNSFATLGGLDATGFQAAIDSLIALYHWPITEAQLNQLDSHDTARFLTMACGEEAAFRMATLLQMTYPGAPCIYYGNEIGMAGGPDPGCRGSFPWDGAHWNHDLLGYVKSLVALRHRHPVLRHGDFVSIYAQNDVYAFARRAGNDVAITAVNASRDERSLDHLTVPDASLTGIIETLGADVPGLDAGAISGWHLPARCGAVLLARR